MNPGPDFVAAICCCWLAEAEVAWSGRFKLRKYFSRAFPGVAPPSSSNSDLEVRKTTDKGVSGEVDFRAEKGDCWRCSRRNPDAGCRSWLGRGTGRRRTSLSSGSRGSSSARREQARWGGRATAEGTGKGGESWTWTKALRGWSWLPLFSRVIPLYSIVRVRFLPNLDSRSLICSGSWGGVILIARRNRGVGRASELGSLCLSLSLFVEYLVVLSWSWRV